MTGCRGRGDLTATERVRGGRRGRSRGHPAPARTDVEGFEYTRRDYKNTGRGFGMGNKSTLDAFRTGENDTERNEAVRNPEQSAGARGESGVRNVGMFVGGDGESLPGKVDVQGFESSAAWTDSKYRGSVNSSKFCQNFFGRSGTNRRTHVGPRHASRHGTIFGSSPNRVGSFRPAFSSVGWVLTQLCLRMRREREATLLANSRLPVTLAQIRPPLQAPQEPPACRLILLPARSS